ncbi:MAG: hypothetical protein ABI333_18765 [bacterium]
MADSSANANANPNRLADQERARDVELITAAMRASVSYHGKAIAFFLALAVLSGTIAVLREIYWLAVVGFGLFGGLASLAFFMTGKSDPDRSPVLRAIRSAPDQVAEVKYYQASSSAGTFVTHWLRIETTDKKWQSIKAAEPDLPLLAAALHRCCPKAKFDVPGFEPPR